jgi:hypothetical protein
LPTQLHFGWVDRCDVKILGRNTICYDRLETGVTCMLRFNRSRTKLDKLAKKVSQDVGRRRGNTDIGARGTLSLFAKLEIQNLKTAPALDGELQCAVQQTGIEEMAFQTENAAGDIGV